MGKKIDAILGRTFKVSKFKSLVNLATSRLAVFKNQRHVRSNQARSDVLQLLQQGHHDRALLRIEHVIKEQNMFDVYVMMEGYCNLLVERVHLVEQDRVCPVELKEAISGLIHASTRCGDFPELQEIRNVFTSRYGKEFVARAIELRNHCEVNPMIIQKLSTRQPDLDSRMRLLKEIASENNIIVKIEDETVKTEDTLDTEKKHYQPKPKTSNNSGTLKLNDDLHNSADEMEGDGLSDSVKTRKKYKDVVDAAQAAFESAAYAAEAARAAVELSRSQPHHPDNQSSPDNQGRKSLFEKDKSTKLESNPRNHEINNENEAEELKDGNAAEKKSSTATNTSNSDMMEDDLRVNSMTLDADHLAKQLEKDIVFYDSESEKDVKEVENKVLSTIQAELEVDSEHLYSMAATEAPASQSLQHLKREKGPISVRTRGVRGY